MNERFDGLLQISSERWVCLTAPRRRSGARGTISGFRTRIVRYHGPYAGAPIPMSRGLGPENPLFHGNRRHYEGPGGPLAQTQLLEGEEVKQLVLDDPSAHGPAKFVAVEGRLGPGVKHILRGKLAVAVEPECATVQFVGTRAGHGNQLSGAV